MLRPSHARHVIAAPAVRALVSFGSHPRLRVVTCCRVGLGMRTADGGIQGRKGTHCRPCHCRRKVPGSCQGSLRSFLPVSASCIAVLRTM